MGSILKTKHFEINLSIDCSSIKPSQCSDRIIEKLKPVLAYENFSSKMTHGPLHNIIIEVYQDDEGLAKKPITTPSKNQLVSLIK